MYRHHIQTIEVGSGGAANITFNSIPQDYDDLLLIASVRSNNLGTVIFMNINGSITNNLRLQGSGTGLYSQYNGPQGSAGFGNGGNVTTANTFASNELLISSYSSTARPKSFSSDAVTENNGSEAYQQFLNGTWNSNSAVTSITLYPDPNQATGWVQYSSASLYGIKRGSDGVTGTAPIAYGGAITSSGGYTYHSFTSSGTFETTVPLSAEVLIVSGGGNGGAVYSGRPTFGHGGGGGGSIITTASLTSGSINVLVGGAESQSYFGELTVTAASGQTPGLNGGLGGGTANADINPGSPGHDLSSYAWAVGPTRPGGGGGGGSNNGGGGATQGGGSGSGGNNGVYASNGGANTGGGGGGGVRGNYGYDRNPAGGGSGIVVVRYPT